MRNHRNLPIRRLVAFIAIASSAALAPAQTATQPDLEVVLANAREAIGIDALATNGGAIEMTGTTDLFGVAGDVSFLIASDGRFRRRVVGHLPETTAFDGDEAWYVNFAHTPRILELGDREDALVAAWLMSGWWLAEAAPLDLEMAETEGENAVAVAFRLEDGFSSGRIELDGETWLPRAAHYQSEHSEQEMRLEGYGTHDGFMMPGQVSITGASGMTTHFNFENAQRVKKDIGDRFEPRLDLPDDVRFDADVPAALHVERAPSGHLMVKASINGAPVDGWFFFDTGAGANCLSTPVAEALGLAPFGKTPAMGVGGYSEAHYYSADTLSVGPATFEDMVLAGLDLSFIEDAIGVKVAGIIGYDVIARCVVEYDGAGPAIALHDPRKYALGDGDWQHLYLYGGHPSVNAEFEGREGIFKIDTGAVGTVMFHAPAVERLALLEGREIADAVSGGVGGMVATRHGTIEYFELGGRRFEAPEVGFAMERKGAFGDPYTTGNMGGTFLQPFVMVLDYQRRRIAFVEK